MTYHDFFYILLTHESWFVRRIESGESLLVREKGAKTKEKR